MFEPVLRFLVCSDIHYEDEVTPVRKYFEDYVTMGYELARQHPRYKSLDALYICGDFLNTGTEAQFLAFRDSLQRVVREETKVVPLLAGHEYVHAAGNGHDAVGKIADMFGPDFWDTVNAPVYAVERLRDILGCEEDTHNVINGFHFIAISNTRTATQWYDSYTKEKMDWLLEQVRIACEDSPNRPVFLFQHHHLYGTVYGKDGWSKPELCLPLVKYPQIVDFSGHSHAPCTDPRSVFQRDYTCVGTGAMYYVEYNDYNAAQGWSAEEGKQCAQGLMVEVSAAGDVLIKVLDPAAGVVRREYLVERPWDPDSFIYTEDRAKNEAKPVFASDADIVVTAESNLLTVDFPQAVGETVQYSVNLRRASDRSIVNRVVTWSKNILHCPPPRLSVTFGDVEPGDYLVDVRPRAPFGTQGEAIEVPFRLTQDAVVVQEL